MLSTQKKPPPWPKLPAERGFVEKTAFDLSLEELRRLRRGRGIFLGEETGGSEGRLTLFIDLVMIYLFMYLRARENVHARRERENRRQSPC